MVQKSHRLDGGFLPCKYWDFNYLSLPQLVSFYPDFWLPSTTYHRIFIQPALIVGSFEVWHSKLRCEVPKAFASVFVIPNTLSLVKESQKSAGCLVFFSFFKGETPGRFDFLRGTWKKLLFWWEHLTGRGWKYGPDGADRTLDVSFGASSRLMNKKWSGSFGRIKTYPKSLTVSGWRRLRRCFFFPVMWLPPFWTSQNWCLEYYSISSQIWFTRVSFCESSLVL